MIGEMRRKWLIIVGERGGTVELAQERIVGPRELFLACSLRWSETRRRPHIAEVLDNKSMSS